MLAGLLNLGILGYSASAKLVVPVSNFITYLGPQYFDTYFPSALSPLLVFCPGDTRNSLDGGFGNTPYCDITSPVKEKRNQSFIDRSVDSFSTFSFS